MRITPHLKTSLVPRLILESTVEYSIIPFGGRWGILHHIRHICTDRAVACESIMVTTSHALGRDRSRSPAEAREFTPPLTLGASGRIPTIMTAVASDLHRGQPSQARAHAARRGGALQFSTLRVSLYHHYNQRSDALLCQSAARVPEGVASDR